MQCKGTECFDLECVKCLKQWEPKNTQDTVMNSSLQVDLSPSVIYMYSEARGDPAEVPQGFKQICKPI